MKLLCIDNLDGGDYLTIGREYEIFGEDYYLYKELGEDSGLWYCCLNDRGDVSCYSVKQFAKIKEHRKQKLEKIGRL